MNIFNCVGKQKLIIGLIHLRPLPGTPLFEEGNVEQSIKKALTDVKALYQGGATGCLVQTVDRIYPADDDADYARVAAVAIITSEVRKAVNPEFIVGVQIMWNCITPSLGVAKACGADFIRATALTGVTSSPYGMVNANPLKVAMYRKLINAQNIAILAEIEGYHFKGTNGDITLGERARAALNVGADAIEVMHSNEEVNNSLVHSIKVNSPSTPVILGGGTNLHNVKTRLKEADGALVGSCFEGEQWGGFIQESIVEKYMTLVRALEYEQ